MKIAVWGQSDGVRPDGNCIDALLERLDRFDHKVVRILSHTRGELELAMRLTEPPS